MRKLSRHRCVFFALIALSLSLLSASAIAASAPPIEGTRLPDVHLKVPDNPDDQRYLGLTGKVSFQIPQVKARVVIIEIFSMYCPYCQREAPKINELYKAIENNEALRGKIKLIGIGAGNSAFEVAVFRDKYKVPFPLLPDEDFSLHKCFGETRTPYFIAVRINDDGSHKVIYSKLGGIEEAKQFLKQMSKRSGLEAGGSK